MKVQPEPKEARAMNASRQSKATHAIVLRFEIVSERKAEEVKFKPMLPTRSGYQSIYLYLK